MSFYATAWAGEVMQGSELPATRRMVLLALADCHNEQTGRCDPSLELMIQKTGLDRHSVPKSIRELESAGLIVVKRAVGKRSSYTLLTSTENRTATSAENHTSTENPTSGENNTAPVPKSPPLPVGKTTHNPGNKPGNNQEESVNAPLPPTRQGELSILLRERGVEVTSFNPYLLSWVENAVTDAEAIEAVERARLHKPIPDRLPAAYLHRVVESVVSERHQRATLVTGPPRRAYEPRKSVEQQNREAAERAKVMLFGEQENVIEGSCYAAE